MEVCCMLKSQPAFDYCTCRGECPDGHQALGVRCVESPLHLCDTGGTCADGYECLNAKCYQRCDRVHICSNNTLCINGKQTGKRYQIVTENSIMRNLWSH